MQQFGYKLYILRSQHKMTLKELAQALGYTAHGHISELEAGKKKPTAEFVLRAARFFNVTTDQLLKDELGLEVSEFNWAWRGMSTVPLSMIYRTPTPQEVERLRLILSTLQDGTGQLTARGEKTTLPGWRDFERAVALVFNGEAQESKAIFDVLIPDPNRKGTFYGISCKMRKALNDVERKGRVTIELSNSARYFWQALSVVGIDQGNYRQRPNEVGRTLIETVESWHSAVSIEGGGNIDLTRSCYLVLSWSESGEYQLHQFPLKLPKSEVTWRFPPNQARLEGNDGQGTVFEWYGEAGGQLKYYPPVTQAIWVSDRFRLEPLPTGGNRYGIWAKAEAYFPELWSKTFTAQT